MLTVNLKNLYTKNSYLIPLPYGTILINNYRTRMWICNGEMSSIDGITPLPDYSNAEYQLKEITKPSDFPQRQNCKTVHEQIQIGNLIIVEYIENSEK